MLPIINQDLLLKIKDSKYVDMVVPNNPNINNNDENLETVQNFCSKLLTTTGAPGVHRLIR